MREISSEPEISRYMTESLKAVERIHSRMGDREFDVSEEFFDLNSQVLGMLAERRKLAEEMMAKKGAIAPPDSQTLAILSAAPSPLGTLQNVGE